MTRSGRSILLCLLLSVGLVAVPAVGAAAQTTPVPPDRPGGTFQDDNGHRHEPHLEALARRDVVRGCDTRLPWVCPDASLTRAQFASLLARSLGLTGDGQHEFADVDPAGAHAASIDAIADAGITAGCTPTRFCPGASLTRGQMASLLLHAFGLEPEQDGPFTDVSGNVHAPAINAIAKAGITEGCTPERYCPTRAIPRGQMATLLGRALDVDPVSPEPGLSGTVAFVRGRAVWTAQGGGAGQRQLTEPPTGERDSLPDWSPVEARLAATRSGSSHTRLVFGDAQSGDVVRSDAAAVRGLWSPDGRMLAFAQEGRDLDTGNHVAVVDAHTGEVRRAVEGEAAVQRFPFGWSADGRELYYQRTADDLTAPSNLFAVDLETGVERRLTGPLEGHRYDDQPSLSPDAGTVAFVRGSRHITEEQEQLVLLDLATGTERVLLEAASIFGVHWRPDGGRLAVNLGEDRSGSLSLHSVAVADGATELLFDQGWAQYVAWSPDGGHLVVRVPRGEDHANAQLYAVNADGSGATAVTAGNTLPGTPVWSPDGGWILHSDDPDGDGTHDLFQVAVDGSDRFRVAVDAVQPAWSPLR